MPVMLPVVLKRMPTCCARCCGAGGTFAQQAEALAAPVDILVGTPGKVAQHAAKGNLFYGDVQLARPAPAAAVQLGSGFRARRQAQPVLRRRAAGAPGRGCSL